MDLPFLLRRAARETPNAPAISDGSSSLTTSELLDYGERLANYLDEQGVQRGSRVGVLSENRVEYLVSDVATALSRNVRVALNARVHLDDHRFVVADTEMRVLFHSSAHSGTAQALAKEFGLLTLSFDAGDEVSPWIRSVADATSARCVVRSGTPQDPGWISYTSGTTGRPKGVVLSHEALCNVAFNLLLELGEIVPGEQIVLAQPLSHGAGYFPLPYLMRGAGVYCQKRFDPEEMWSLSNRLGIRTVKVVPAMLPRILEAAGSNWGYETTIYGASPISAPVLDACIDRFGFSLIQLYGKTEAPATITCLRKHEHVGATRLSGGRPWRTVEVEIRDPDGQVCELGETGELFVRGPHVMSRYYNNRAATDESLVGGWLATADMASFDAEGFVHLKGRGDELIISGGFNIAPKEVEDVLTTYQGVQEAVVFGVPDARWGTAVAAVLQVHALDEIKTDDVMAFARDRLGYRSPKRVVLVRDIPRTPYGKVDRRALNDLLEHGQVDKSNA